MSKFDIKYTILLKDKFTAVSHKITKSLSKMDAGMHASGERLERLGLKLGRVSRNLVIPIAGSLSKMDAGMHASGERLERLGLKLGRISRNLIIPFAGMALAFREGAKAADEQIVSLKTLSFAINKHTQKYLKPIIEKTEKFEKVTRFSQESMLEAAKTMALFSKNGRVVNETLLPMMNMSAATGYSLQTISMILAKSLTSSDNQLSRYGITVKKGVTGLAKYQTILAALQSRFKGQAVLMGKTGLGPIIILGHLMAMVWKDVALVVIPVLDKIASKMSVWVISLDKLVKGHHRIIIQFGLVITAIFLMSGAILFLNVVVELLTLTLGVLKVALSVLMTPKKLGMMTLFLVVGYLIAKFNLLPIIIANVVSFFKVLRLVVLSVRNAIMDVNSAILHFIKLLGKIPAIGAFLQYYQNLYKENKDLFFNPPAHSGSVVQHSGSVHVKVGVDDPGNRVTYVTATPSQGHTIKYLGANMFEGGT